MTAKTVHGGKFIAMYRIHITKEERSKTNKPGFHPWKLEREEQINPKVAKEKNKKN